MVNAQVAAHTEVKGKTSSTQRVRGDLVSMESNLSYLSSLKDEDHLVYIQPHYKESYRLAIYALLCGGKEAYEEFLRAEQISHLLSEEEIFFILENAKLPIVEDDPDLKQVVDETSPSTYFPSESDEEVPDLDLGWPEVTLEGTDTSISLLFHPPRQNTPTIKEVVRKQIQEARQIIAIAMDVFTDVDIFKEIIGATLRGVVVYILLDDSHFKSFFTMTQRVGIKIRDFKNIRVRTVQGQLYQCQSGVKFHGGLDQKFILVDCRTVLYGSYSLTWSYEKIHVSMVLVITGQLVCSYDEEFRRLFARSIVPAILSNEKPSFQYPRDSATFQSPNSSQLSLHQIHMKSRMMHATRTTQDDRFNSTTVLTRGLSVQDRLHQSHCADVGNMVRGHSYGGELQKLNSITRLRRGTKDVEGPAAPERNCSNMRTGGDFLMASRQQLRHRTLYGADQNRIPFSSETSLHKWKIDTYLSENNTPSDAPCNTLTPLTSPYSSHTGLNEHQSQLIHSRSRDIKSRMEEMRQKRLSLQDYSNLRQSQESLRSMYPTLERSTYMSSLRGLDMRQSMAELEPNAQNGHNMESTDQKVNDTNKDSNKRESTKTYDKHEPQCRTGSAADLEMKINEPLLKLAGLSGVQHPRTMESLVEIPEEKDGSNPRVNSLEPAAFNNGHEETHKDKSDLPKERLPAESWRQNQSRGSCGSVGQVANTSLPAVPTEREKTMVNQVENAPKIFNTYSGSQDAAEAKSVHTEKPREEPTLQRKNSLRMKVQSLLSSDDKKASKKEEKTLQRKGSIRSQNPLGPNQTLQGEQSRSSAAEQNSIGNPAETEKNKSSPFSRLTPLRSSKKKTNVAAEPDRGSKSTADNQGTTIFHTRREKAYSRFEYLLSTETIPVDKSTRTAGAYSLDRSSTLNHDSGYSMYQTQSGTDNKLGRFMQRVGNLIHKNK